MGSDLRKRAHAILLLAVRRCPTVSD
jgi:hypothetical protein